MSSYSLNTPYITVAGVIVIAMVAMFSVINPMLQTARQIRTQILGQEATLKEKQDFLKNLGRKREELQIQRVHEERLNVMFPTDDAFDDALRVINLAATGSGATIQKISDHSANIQSALNSRRSRGDIDFIPEKVTPLGAQVEITGTYQQLRLMLENLEKSPRLTDVISLS
ncbi:MAG: hypothetical protein HYZ63_03225, partial [Candidatus Andersenbacteria bacterium]|nr:hypothetical protein [Candidatus Andersenbacteria bacterium]